MRKTLLCLLAASALHCEAAPDVEGRWSGRAALPGRDLELVVDLARDAAGAWAGSLILRGYDVKGAPLGNVKVDDDGVTFDTGEVLAAGPDGPATFRARLESPGVLAGTFAHAGNQAPLRLERVGPAQVEPAPRPTPVSRAAEGRWVGRYELGGYPREVTVEIANQGAAMPKVDFVVVGKATTRLPIDFVAEEEGVVRIESHAYRITFQGRVHDDRIEGTFEQGPFEIPLVLRRPERKTS